MITAKSSGYIKHFIVFLYSSSLLASTLGLEVGQTKTVLNNFAIPNTDKDKISLPVDDTLTISTN